MVLESRGKPNNPLQRSFSTCSARTYRDETYWTSNRSARKIIPDRAGRDDRRGSGASRPAAEFGLSGLCADQW
jgi:hypothetical protein